VEMSALKAKLGLVGRMSVQAFVSGSEAIFTLFIQKILHLY